jgi:hypothetical protein
MTRNYRNGKLIYLIIFLLRTGQIFGVFRFNYSNTKRTNRVVKSIFLEIYSRILWITALIYFPYSYYLDVNQEYDGRMDITGFVLFKSLSTCLFVTSCLMLLSIFCSIFLGSVDLFELTNEGFKLYALIKRLKLPASSTDRIFWKLFIKIFLIEIPIVFTMAIGMFLELPANVPKYSLGIFYNCIRYICLNILNAVLLYSTHLCKLIRLKLLEKKGMWEQVSLFHSFLTVLFKIYKVFGPILLAFYLDLLLKIVASVEFYFMFHTRQSTN